MRQAIKKCGAAAAGVWVLMGLWAFGLATERSMHIEGRVPADIRAAEGFDAAESAGLFVGIRTFEDAELAEVPFAVDDAIDLAHLFVLELALIDPRHVTLALSGEPQKPESVARLRRLVDAGAIKDEASLTKIYKQLERRSGQTGAHGLLVVTMATHGFNVGSQDFLVGADSSKRLIQHTGIVVDAVFDEVSRAPALRRLILLDACRERLSSNIRSIGRPSPESAMGQAFAQAIARASGQVVLSSTTLGGYAYDDYDQKNGVFSAAVMRGLRGAAPSDARHFITAQTLAGYVAEQVQGWVRRNSPAHMTLSQGISSRFEGPAMSMPLAVDPRGIQAAVAQANRARQEAALQRLRQNIGGTITGAMYDKVVQVLDSPLSAEQREELLAKLEQLDGSEVTQLRFAYYFEVQASRLLPPEPQGSMTSSPPVDRARLERLQPPPVSPETTSPSAPPGLPTYKLTVRAVPVDSTIKITNIKPRYFPGMALEPGLYKLLVQRSGYQTVRQEVTIQDTDVTLDVVLIPKEIKTEGNSEPLGHSDTEAVERYRKAAEQGNAIAQFNLGVMYEQGRGVGQSDTKAVAWFRQAAEQGYAYAQFNLGFMYEEGRGVGQSDAEAVAWYRKAAEQGNAYAKKKIEKLVK